MSAVAAARLGDEIAHGMGVAAMIGGAIVGAIVGAAIVAAAAVAAPLTIAIIVGGSIAIGALSMKQLVKGISTVFN
jgi:acyl dehydratase